jgi:hypothetical protein
MDRQKIFTKVKNHLLKQYKKSGKRVGKTFQCLYRGPNGTRCAIGCLIPNKLYRKGWEGKGAIGIEPILKHLGCVSVQDDVFVNNLQGIHDDYPVSQWVWHLKKFAQVYNLTY